MATDVSQEFIRPALSATGRFQCPVADRVERTRCVPLLPESVDAYTIDILSYSHESQNLVIDERGGE